MELIDKEKALIIAESYGTTHGGTVGRHSGVADAIHYELDKLPTIEAKTVKHGEWIPIDSYWHDYSTNHAAEFQCSVCTKSVYYDYYTRFCDYNYCPNCGAKMEKNNGD